jgi:hypothetical protein
MQHVQAEFGDLERAGASRLIPIIGQVYPIFAVLGSILSRSRNKPAAGGAGPRIPSHQAPAPDRGYSFLNS